MALFARLMPADRRDPSLSLSSIFLVHSFFRAFCNIVNYFFCIYHEMKLESNLFPAK
jgi:hypothetical protein